MFSYGQHSKCADLLNSYQFLLLFLAFTAIVCTNSSYIIRPGAIYLRLVIHRKLRPSQRCHRLFFLFGQFLDRCLPAHRLAARRIFFIVCQHYRTAGFRVFCTFPGIVRRHPALPDGSSTRSTRFRPRSAKDMYNSCLILPLWFALPTKISQYTGKRIRTPYVNGAAPCNARAPPGSGNSFPGSIIKHRPDAFSWLTRQKSFVKVKSAWIFACNCKDIEPLQ